MLDIFGRRYSAKLALRLAADGHIIHALACDERKGQSLLDDPMIRLFTRDILDPKSLLNAIAGCEPVYHLAALASVWHKDPQSFHTKNERSFKTF